MTARIYDFEQERRRLRPDNDEIVLCDDSPESIAESARILGEWLDRQMQKLALEPGGPEDTA